MKKYTFLFFLFLIAATALGDNHLILLTTNDTHSQIDPDIDGKGGVLRRKVIIDSVRNVQKNVLLIDAGDAVQGTLYFSMFGGKVDYALMDSLGYDIQILGNHEFDNGIDSIATFYNKLHSTRLSTNYDFSHTKLANCFKEYDIRKYGDKKVGFIGINLEPKGMISENNYKGLIYKNILSTADSMAEVLKKQMGVDYVVMISHIGYASSGNGIIYDPEVIKKSHYIDAVIGGHSHTLVVPNSKNSKSDKIKNADGKEVLITQVGKAGKYVGLIDIDLDDMEANYELIAVNKRLDDRIDKNLEKWLAPYKNKVDSVMSYTIAQSAKEMSNRNLGALTNWISDVALALSKNMTTSNVDFAIMNKGGIRRGMPKGDISAGVIDMMLPFDNKLVVLRMKGSDIIKSFEIMARRYGDAVSKDVKVLYTKANKISSARIGGKKIDPNKYYNVATVDYLANGGDYMVPMKSSEVIARDNKKFGDRVLEYVIELGKKDIIINPSDESRMYRIN